jgi:hypothetical protein
LITALNLKATFKQSKQIANLKSSLRQVPMKYQNTDLISQRSKKIKLVLVIEFKIQIKSYLLKVNFNENHSLVGQKNALKGAYVQ